MPSSNDWPEGCVLNLLLVNCSHAVCVGILLLLFVTIIIVIRVAVLETLLF